MQQLLALDHTWSQAQHVAVQCGLDPYWPRPVLLSPQPQLAGHTPMQPQCLLYTVSHSCSMSASLFIQHLGMISYQLDSHLILLHGVTAFLMQSHQCVLPAPWVPRHSLAELDQSLELPAMQLPVPTKQLCFISLTVAFVIVVPTIQLGFAMLHIGPSKM